MNYNEFKGMQKQALNLANLVGAGVEAFGQLGSFGATVLIAALAGTGGAAGWGLAKMHAKDSQDINTIQKEYENERLKSDIGYLATKLTSEYDAWKNKQAPKPARVIA
jgi:hypothetical protein